VLAVLLVTLTPLSEETWLNSINSQVYLTVCVGLILMARPRGGAVGSFHVAVLLIAVLSGPAPTFAAPLFLLRSVLDRSPWRWAQAAAVSAGAVLQLSLVLLQLREGRDLDFTPYLLLCIIYSKHVLVTLYGRLQADELSRDLLHYVDAGHIAFTPAVAVAALLAVLVWGVLATNRSELKWLLAFTIILILGTYFGAFGKKIELIHASTGARYAVAPGILVSLIAFGISRTATGYTRIAATALVVWLLVIGTSEYFKPDPQAAQGPDWQSEVQAWRKDPSMPLHTWPRGWSMHLWSPASSAQPMQ
jgi:hypothetical protein